MLSLFVKKCPASWLLWLECIDARLSRCVALSAAIFGLSLAPCVRLVAWVWNWLDHLFKAAPAAVVMKKEHQSSLWLVRCQSEVRSLHGRWEET